MRRTTLALMLSVATPAMAQWFAAKAEHPDALVFFRMGDFYELFFADAEAAAEALDIALTYRGEHRGERIAMCGVPAHSHEGYLARLIRRGFRVAVCDQMETPEEAKRRKATTIRREVVRLVTPGTVTEEGLLDGARPAWLLALAPDGDAVGAAWLDVTTGALETETLPARADLPATLRFLEEIGHTGAPRPVREPLSTSQRGTRQRESQEREPDADLGLPLGVERQPLDEPGARQLERLVHLVLGRGEPTSHAVRHRPEREQQELLLVGEVVDHSAGRPARLVRDAPHRHGLEPLAGRQPPHRRAELGAAPLVIYDLRHRGPSLYRTSDINKEWS